jgi:hypothetical protein
MPRGQAPLTESPRSPSGTAFQTPRPPNSIADVGLLANAQWRAHLKDIVSSLEDVCQGANLKKLKVED